MTEFERDTTAAADASGNTTEERQAAHERVASGALAGWMRICATHPWRIVFSWIGIIATLIVLVATVGGSLQDEFTIPGSDTQKATDLLKAEFASEQGGVLNLVFAAPEGERLDTPARKVAIGKAITRLKSSEFKPVDGTAGGARYIVNGRHACTSCRVCAGSVREDRSRV